MLIYVWANNKNFITPFQGGTYDWKQMIKLWCDRYQNADTGIAYSNVFHCGMRTLWKCCWKLKKLPTNSYEILWGVRSLTSNKPFDLGADPDQCRIQKFLTEFCKNFAGLAVVVEVCDVRYQYNVISTQQKQRSSANRIHYVGPTSSILTYWFHGFYPTCTEVSGVENIGSTAD